MLTKRRFLQWAMAGVVCLTATIGVAATAAQFRSAINIAGRQRMLSQKIAKCSYLLVVVGDNEKVKSELDKAKSLFKTSLNGLLQGSDDMNLPAPPNADIKSQYETVQGTWKKMSSIVSDVESSTDKTDTAVLDKLASLNIQLLKESNAAVKLYVKAAADSGLPAAGVQIDIAGRQRMLTQKIAKEAFMYTAGVDASASQKQAEKTMSLFSKSLAGLKEGDSSMQLEAANTSDQKDQISVIKKAWQKYHSFVDRTLGANMKSKRIALKINKSSNKVLVESNKLVKLLEKQS